MYPLKMGIKDSLCKENGEVSHLVSVYLLNRVASQVPLSNNLILGCIRSQILYSAIVLQSLVVSLSIGT